MLRPDRNDITQIIWWQLHLLQNFGIEMLFNTQDREIQRKNIGALDDLKVASLINKKRVAVVKSMAWFASQHNVGHVVNGLPKLKKWWDVNVRGNSGVRNQMCTAQLHMHGLQNAAETTIRGQAQSIINQ